MGAGYISPHKQPKDARNPIGNSKGPNLFTVSRNFWHKKPDGNQRSQHTDKSTFGVAEYTIFNVSKTELTTAAVSGLHALRNHNLSSRCEMRRSATCLLCHDAKYEWECGRTGLTDAISQERRSGEGKKKWKKVARNTRSTHLAIHPIAAVSTLFRLI